MNFYIEGKVVFLMKKQTTMQCQYCHENKCYANAATSPEEYDSHPILCHGCKTPVLKKEV